ncbi:hypothetical protein KUTeg_014559 [Tegillarca granosa]|uniref:Uncharacterized protein n=1 Tax=Tegillarca granosa TaxID=220873 RepID=A0ABQ9ERQ7_TEGGR|nr:hypothetical protein KUTeg_014559 [Tegillarca granosa]
MKITLLAERSQSVVWRKYAFSELLIVPSVVSSTHNIVAYRFTDQCTIDGGIDEVRRIRRRYVTFVNKKLNIKKLQVDKFD